MAFREDWLEAFLWIRETFRIEGEAAASAAWNLALLETRERMERDAVAAVVGEVVVVPDALREEGK